MFTHLLPRGEKMCMFHCLMNECDAFVAGLEAGCWQVEELTDPIKATKGNGVALFLDTSSNIQYRIFFRPWPVLCICWLWGETYRQSTFLSEEHLLLIGRAGPTKAIDILASDFTQTASSAWVPELLPGTAMSSTLLPLVFKWDMGLMACLYSCYHLAWGAKSFELMPNQMSEQRVRACGVALDDKTFWAISGWPGSGNSRSKHLLYFLLSFLNDSHTHKLLKYEELS